MVWAERPWAWKWEQRPAGSVVPKDPRVQEQMLGSLCFSPGFPDALKQPKALNQGCQMEKAAA